MENTLISKNKVVEASFQNYNNTDINNVVDSVLNETDNTLNETGNKLNETDNKLNETDNQCSDEVENSSQVVDLCKEVVLDSTVIIEKKHSEPPRQFEGLEIDVVLGVGVKVFKGKPSDGNVSTSVASAMESDLGEVRGLNCTGVVSNIWESSHSIVDNTKEQCETKIADSSSDMESRNTVKVDSENVIEGTLTQEPVVIEQYADCEALQNASKIGTHKSDYLCESGSSIWEDCFKSAVEESEKMNLKNNEIDSNEEDVVVVSHGNVSPEKDKLRNNEITSNEEVDVISRGSAINEATVKTSDNQDTLLSDKSSNKPCEILVINDSPERDKMRNIQIAINDEDVGISSRSAIKETIETSDKQAISLNAESSNNLSEILVISHSPERDKLKNSEIYINKEEVVISSAFAINEETVEISDNQDSSSTGILLDKLCVSSVIKNSPDRDKLSNIPIASNEEEVVISSRSAINEDTVETSENRATLSTGEPSNKQCENPVIIDFPEKDKLMNKEITSNEEEIVISSVSAINEDKIETGHNQGTSSTVESGNTRSESSVTNDSPEKDKLRNNEITSKEEEIDISSKEGNNVGSNTISVPASPRNTAVNKNKKVQGKLSNKELEVLKSFQSHTKCPSDEDIASLSDQTNLSESRIQAWFLLNQEGSGSSRDTSIPTPKSKPSKQFPPSNRLSERNLQDLTNYLAHTPYPTYKQKKELVKDLNVQASVVETWIFRIQVQNEIQKNSGGELTDEFMNMTSCKMEPVEEPQPSDNENQDDNGESITLDDVRVFGEHVDDADDDDQMVKVGMSSSSSEVQTDQSRRNMFEMFSPKSGISSHSRMNLKTEPNVCGYGDDDGGDGIAKRSYGRKYTQFQISTLQSFFEKKQLPHFSDIRNLAAKTNLSVVQVQKWFNNRRHRHFTPRKIYLASSGTSIEKNTDKTNIENNSEKLKINRFWSATKTLSVNHVNDKVPTDYKSKKRRTCCGLTVAQVKGLFNFVFQHSTSPTKVQINQLASQLKLSNEDVWKWMYNLRLNPNGTVKKKIKDNVALTKKYSIILIDCFQHMTERPSKDQIEKLSELVNASQTKVERWFMQKRWVNHTRLRKLGLLKSSRAQMYKKHQHEKTDDQVKYANGPKGRNMQFLSHQSRNILVDFYNNRTSRPTKIQMDNLANKLRINVLKINRWFAQRLSMQNTGKLRIKDQRLPVVNFNQAQLKVMDSLMERSRRPMKLEKKKLAEQIGSTYKCVTRWFCKQAYELRQKNLSKENLRYLNVYFRRNPIPTEKQIEKITLKVNKQSKVVNNWFIVKRRRQGIVGSSTSAIKGKMPSQVLMPQQKSESFRSKVMINYYKTNKDVGINPIKMKLHDCNTIHQQLQEDLKIYFNKPVSSTSVDKVAIQFGVTKHSLCEWMIENGNENAELKKDRVNREKVISNKQYVARNMDSCKPINNAKWDKSEEETEILTKFFNKNPYPLEEDCYKLGQLMNQEPPKVDRWFHNQRMKKNIRTNSNLDSLRVNYKRFTECEVEVLRSFYNRFRTSYPSFHLTQEIDSKMPERVGFRRIMNWFKLTYKKENRKQNRGKNDSKILPRSYQIENTEAGNEDFSVDDDHDSDDDTIGDNENNGEEGHDFSESMNSSNDNTMTIVDMDRSGGVISNKKYVARNVESNSPINNAKWDKSEEERKILTKFFEKNPYPLEEDCYKLGHLMNQEPPKVDRWFNKQRMKKNIKSNQHSRKRFTECELEILRSFYNRFRTSCPSFRMIQEIDSNMPERVGFRRIINWFKLTYKKRKKLQKSYQLENAEAGNEDFSVDDDHDSDDDTIGDNENNCNQGNDFSESMNTSNDNSILDNNMVRSGGVTGEKWSKTPEEVEILTKCFNKNPYPSDDDYNKLEELIPNQDAEKLESWFTKQRMKNNIHKPHVKYKRFTQEEVNILKRHYHKSPKPTYADLKVIESELPEKQGYSRLLSWFKCQRKKSYFTDEIINDDSIASSSNPLDYKAPDDRCNKNAALSSRRNSGNLSSIGRKCLNSSGAISKVSSNFSNWSKTPRELQILNKIFENNPFPSLEECAKLAKQMNQERKKIEKWFINKRHSSNMQKNHRQHVFKNITQVELAILKKYYRKNPNPKYDLIKKIQNALPEKQEIRSIMMWFRAERKREALRKKNYTQLKSKKIMNQSKTRNSDAVTDSLISSHEVYMDNADDEEYDSDVLDNDNHVDYKTPDDRCYEKAALSSRRNYENLSSIGRKCLNSSGAISKLWSKTPRELQILNKIFENNPFPSLEECAKLAKQMNQERKKIEKWFINKRHSSNMQKNHRQHVFKNITQVELAILKKYYCKNPNPKYDLIKKIQNALPEKQEIRSIMMWFRAERKREALIKKNYTQLKSKKIVNTSKTRNSDMVNDLPISSHDVYMDNADDVEYDSDVDDEIDYEEEYTVDTSSSSVKSNVDYDVASTSYLSIGSAGSGRVGFETTIDAIPAWRAMVVKKEPDGGGNMTAGEKEFKPVIIEQRHIEEDGDTAENLSLRLSVDNAVSISSRSLSVNSNTSSVHTHHRSVSESPASIPSTSQASGVNEDGLSVFQVKKLKTMFERNQNPSMNEMEIMSNLLDLDLMVLVKWYTIARKKATETLLSYVQPTSAVSPQLLQLLPTPQPPVSVQLPQGQYIAPNLPTQPQHSHLGAVLRQPPPYPLASVQLQQHQYIEPTVPVQPQQSTLGAPLGQPQLQHQPQTAASSIISPQQSQQPQQQHRSQISPVGSLMLPQQQQQQASIVQQAIQQHQQALQQTGPTYLPTSTTVSTNLQLQEALILQLQQLQQQHPATVNTATSLAQVVPLNNASYYNPSLQSGGNMVQQQVPSVAQQPVQQMAGFIQQQKHSQHETPTVFSQSKAKTKQPKQKNQSNNGNSGQQQNPRIPFPAAPKRIQQPGVQQQEQPQHIYQQQQQQQQNSRVLLPGTFNPASTAIATAHKQSMHHQNQPQQNPLLYQTLNLPPPTSSNPSSQQIAAAAQYLQHAPLPGVDQQLYSSVLSGATPPGSRSGVGSDNIPLLGNQGQHRTVSRTPDSSTGHVINISPE